MAIASTRHCVWVGSTFGHKAFPRCSWLWSLLDLRDLLASLDPSAAKFGFCDRGVELASLIHVSAHGGEASPALGRKAKRWLRKRAIGLRCGRSSRTQPRPRTHQPPSEEQRETSIAMEMAA